MLLALLVVLAGPVAKAPRVPKPRAVVYVSTQTGMVPFEVRASAYLRDQGHELNCPEVTWEWRDGSVSTRASDCDPYEMGRPDRWSADPQSHVYRRMGDLVLRVTFRSLGRPYPAELTVIAR
jgi:hypothetical protein